MMVQQNRQTKSVAGRGALISSFVLFAIYFINVLVGKINISYGLTLPHFGNIAEFLLLFAFCIMLIIAALKRETMEDMLLTQTEKEVKNGE